MPFTVCYFIANVTQPIFPDLAFSSEGCWKYCSLMRGCELWHGLTAWPILLVASLRPDFRPVEGELSTAPESHFLSCWELESCHEDRPQCGPGQSGSTEALFPGWKGFLDSMLFCPGNRVEVKERMCKWKNLLVKFLFSMRPLSNLSQIEKVLWMQDETSLPPERSPVIMTKPSTTTSPGWLSIFTDFLVWASLAVAQNRTNLQSVISTSVGLLFPSMTIVSKSL